MLFANIEEKRNLFGFKIVGFSKKKEKDSFTSTLGHPSSPFSNPMTNGKFFFSFVQHFMVEIKPSG